MPMLAYQPSSTCKEIADIVMLQYIALFLQINLDLYLSGLFLYPGSGTLGNGDIVALIGFQ